jgi:hypothetical protein
LPARPARPVATLRPLQSSPPPGALQPPAAPGPPATSFAARPVHGRFRFWLPESALHRLPRWRWHAPGSKLLSLVSLWLDNNYQIKTKILQYQKPKKFSEVNKTLLFFNSRSTHTRLYRLPSSANGPLQLGQSSQASFQRVWPNRATRPRPCTCRRPF